MRKKASRPSDGSPAVFFGVTLSAQSDFLDLGGSELEGPDSLPLLILHLCDCNRSVGVVTVVLCAADLVLGSELDLDGVAGGSSCGAAGCCGSSAGGSGRAAGGGQLSCNSRTGQIKNALAQCAKTAPTVDIPTGWNPNTKKEPSGLFFAACGRPCSFDSSYGLHETATTLDIPSCWDPRANQSPTGALVAVLCTAALFDSRTGQIKNPPSECSRDFYDPYGNRTHVTAVKGPCLNRLTNGP